MLIDSIYHILKQLFSILLSNETFLTLCLIIGLSTVSISHEIPGMFHLRRTQSFASFIVSFFLSFRIIHVLHLSRLSWIFDHSFMFGVVFLFIMNSFFYSYFRRFSHSNKPVLKSLMISFSYEDSVFAS